MALPRSRRPVMATPCRPVTVESDLYSPAQKVQATATGAGAAALVTVASVAWDKTHLPDRLVWDTILVAGVQMALSAGARGVASAPPQLQSRAGFSTVHSQLVYHALTCVCDVDRSFRSLIASASSTTVLWMAKWMQRTWLSGTGDSFQKHILSIRHISCGSWATRTIVAGRMVEGTHHQLSPLMKRLTGLEK